MTQLSGDERPDDRTAAPARLSGADRRRQLIGIGLRMLTKRPIHELVLDEVAAEAGISRGLLFHYFPTKSDYYAAVVRAAARRLVRATEPRADAPPGEQLVEVLDTFVAFLERRRDLYLALFRGASGGADYLVEIYDRTRDVFTERTITGLGPVEVTPELTLVVRGWFSFVEDVALTWAQDRPFPREDLLRLLADALPALLITAGHPEAARAATRPA
ncbi:TetR/AcrR family transcriptional regulator [Streptomyces sp. DSM 44917]|uniref:TetR/AcrR family transcriptional regulator n=1 Tax=Streptomyces boetiae TaxID=3075541 RepID=A0ABU2L219_9ACTN|nr:TetR/AcrR family transcriptional regulator [Streptomyces sp. DSM 44917]MDT0305437.1 TetR/AcrR family transcriptional regulator [Streptomyces sp. DSM 44917]